MFCTHWLFEDEEFKEFKERLHYRVNLDEEIGEMTIDEARYCRPFGADDPRPRRNIAPPPEDTTIHEVYLRIYIFITFL